MLAANQAVASWLVRKQVPCVHRVHEPPSDEAVARLANLFAQFGLLEADAASVALDGPRIARALVQVAGRPAERLVHWTALRAMRQARYEAESRGHFALGFEHYTHFTSPIRRCADLAVHRAFKGALPGGSKRSTGRSQTVATRQSAGAAQGPHALSGAEAMARVAARASIRERVAVQAERAVRAVKQAAVMAGHLGESFAARVSGVAEIGVFVSLEDPFVEGLVELRSLGEGFELDRDSQRLVAPRSGRSIGLGDEIEVRAEAVDVFRGWIRFGLAALPSKKMG
jgi:ribonuclease R